MTQLGRLVTLLALVLAVLPAPAWASPEDTALQDRVLGDAYGLLMDHYVQPLDSAALLQAGWAELAREAAESNADPPGPPPALSGDRAGDLTALETALNSYLGGASAAPDSFVAAHAVIRGMTHFVDESHTYFLNPEQYQEYQSWSRGDNRYVGVGISLGAAATTGTQIVEVYDGTPAQQAGLRVGDRLLAINDQDVSDQSPEQITALIHGPVGSGFRLAVQRGDDPTPLSFSLERAEIHLQFVTQRLVDDVGYVSLRGFPEPSVVQSVEQDLATFEREGVHGLVLDLRGNTGGRIDVGTRLLGDFLPSGSSIYEEVDRDGRNQLHVTHGAGAQYDLPLVVLVDSGTASMGEIFASAVQEHGVAMVVGQNTAGSVAAAQVFALPDGSGLQVTVFDILSADGKPLNQVGVAPDQVVDATAIDPSGQADPTLSRALALLHDGQGAAQVPAQSGAASAAAGPSS